MISTKFHEGDFLSSARASLAISAKNSLDKAAIAALSQPGSILLVDEVGDVTPISPDPTRMELDNEILRDLLVDMCSATQPGSPPSQEDWNQIRNMVKAVAVRHALLIRDEKKDSAKKSLWPEELAAMPPRHGKAQMISSMLPDISLAGLNGSKPISGRSASFLIIDDVI